MSIKATHYIAQFLAERGVSHVFEMSGGMITHILDSIHLHGKTKIISVHHEQVAAFAADAFGRMTGIPGVAMATSGPGATNLLTGIGSCHFDGAPAVFITGQVNRHEQKGERAIRQLGFQETDIVAMARPITKAAWMINEPDDLPRMLREAFHLATSGRPGPVLLDIPMDVQNTRIEPQGADAAILEVGEETDPISLEKRGEIFQELFAALDKAERPLILIGGGVRSSRSAELLREFARMVQIPVVHSLMASDVLPYNDPLRAGFLGSYGNRWSNMAIGRADLLLVLGSRLDVRQTGADVKSFQGERVIYHVDVEPGEMNNRVTGCHTVVSDLRAFLTSALRAADDYSFADHGAWINEIEELRQTWPDTDELADAEGINPNLFMHQLSRVSQAAAAWCVDVGQHQMWAAQSAEMGADQRFFTSGGMGSMGFALPAAIGAAVAAEGRPIVVVAGDGGFQTNIHELQTIVRNQMPVKMVVINNNCHGMVRQFQQSYFEDRYQSTLWGYSAPDFERVAKAYDIPAWTVATPDEVEGGLQELWRDPSAPGLLQVMVDTYTNVYPKMAFGRPITEMEPFAKPIAMEST